METKYMKIQKKKKKRSTLNAKLNLIIYDGSIEIKKRR